MKKVKKIFATNYCFEKCKWVRVKDGMIYCKMYSAQVTMESISTINEECAEYENISVF